MHLQREWSETEVNPRVLSSEIAARRHTQPHTMRASMHPLLLALLVSCCAVASRAAPQLVLRQTNGASVVADVLDGQTYGVAGLSALSLNMEVNIPREL